MRIEPEPALRIIEFTSHPAKIGTVLRGTDSKIRKECSPVLKHAHSMNKDWIISYFGCKFPQGCLIEWAAIRTAQGDMNIRTAGALRHDLP